MVTYQLQDRKFKLHSESDWTFPNDVEIEVCFEPQEQFGTSHGFSRTALRATPAQAQYNANNGRGLNKSEKPLDPVEVVAGFADVTFHLKGNKLLLRTRCTTVAELHQRAYHLYAYLPPILNVYLADPAYISSVKAKVNGKV